MHNMFLSLQRDFHKASLHFSFQSLRALNRFATYNSEWIAAAVSTATTSAPAHLLIRPWGSEERPQQDPHDMMNREEDNSAKLSTDRVVSEPANFGSFKDRCCM